jgi:hypothetical protein
MKPPNAGHHFFSEASSLDRGDLIDSLNNFERTEIVRSVGAQDHMR